MGYEADIADAFNGKRRFHLDWGTGYLYLRLGAGAYKELTGKKITYGSAQRPGWLPPSGAIPPFYGLPYPRHGKHPSILVPVLAA